MPYKNKEAYSSLPIPGLENLWSLVELNIFQKPLQQ